MSENLVSKAFIEFLNTVSVPSTTKCCPGCGTELGNLNRPFFFEGQTWQIPLQICVKCHPIEQVAPPYDA
ncbi:MAG: hypothetical protein WBP65_03750 [Candidatus Sulfotelmatobacter sp.]|jgi:hypothetical protein